MSASVTRIKILGGQCLISLYYYSEVIQSPSINFGDFNLAEADAGSRSPCLGTFHSYSGGHDCWL